MNISLFIDEKNRSYNVSFIICHHIIKITINTDVFIKFIFYILLNKYDLCK